MCFFFFGGGGGFKGQPTERCVCVFLLGGPESYFETSILGGLTYFVRRVPFNFKQKSSNTGQGGRYAGMFLFKTNMPPRDPFLAILPGFEQSGSHFGVAMSMLEDFRAWPAEVGKCWESL